MSFKIQGMMFVVNSVHENKKGIINIRLQVNWLYTVTFDIQCDDWQTKENMRGMKWYTTEQIRLYQNHIIAYQYAVSCRITSQITAALNSLASPILTCRGLSILSGNLYARNSYIWKRIFYRGWAYFQTKGSVCYDLMGGKLSVVYR